MLKSAALLIPLLLVVMVSRTAGAKGPVAAIEIDGPGFEEPIEVTSGDALLDFNPWAQRFLGGAPGAEPDGGESLTVTLYLKNAEGEREPAYRFSYYQRTSGGLIYLPGPGDVDYDLNKTTILGAHDGEWWMASPEWDAIVSEVLAIRPPSTGSAGLK